MPNADLKKISRNSGHTSNEADARKVRDDERDVQSGTNTGKAREAHKAASTEHRQYRPLWGGEYEGTVC